MTTITSQHLTEALLFVLGETFDNMRTIGGAIGVIAHTAYHLDEIRQALCTIRM